MNIGHLFVCFLQYSSKKSEVIFHCLVSIVEGGGEEIGMQKTCLQWAMSKFILLAQHFQNLILLPRVTRFSHIAGCLYYTEYAPVTASPWDSSLTWDPASFLRNTLKYHRKKEVYKPKFSEGWRSSTLT